MKTMPDRPTPSGDAVQQIDPTAPDQSGAGFRGDNTCVICSPSAALSLTSAKE